MIGVRAFGLYRNRALARTPRRCCDQVRRLKVGCVVVFESEVELAAARCSTSCRTPPTSPSSSPRTWSAGCPSASAAGWCPCPTRWRIGRHAVGGGRALHRRGDGARGARAGHPLGVRAGGGRQQQPRATPSSTSAPTARTRSWWARMIAAFVRGRARGRAPDHGQALPGARRHRGRQPPAARHRHRRPRAAGRGRAAARSAARSRPGWTR